MLVKQRRAGQPNEKLFKKKSQKSKDYRPTQLCPSKDAADKKAKDAADRKAKEAADKKAKEAADKIFFLQC